MDLTVKDIAKRLNVSEKTIYRMVKGEAIPCFRVGGQWRFHEGEILSWLEDAKEVTKSFREEKHHGSEEAISLADFLRRGGIYYRIGGDSKETVIRESLHTIKPGAPPEEIDRLFTAIKERENLCSTGIGHGVALPHPRRFKEFVTPLSSISLCFLDKKIPFQSVDGEDVQLLFFIFPRNEERYLKIQSKLLRLLREPEVLSRLKEIPLREEIYDLFLRAEEEALGGGTK